MRETGSEYLSMWLADGTNYPGQDDFRARKHRLQEELAAIYAAMDENMKMLIEYKFFEPAFYHTDIGDWGMATTFANKLGDRALTLVDTGHHPLGTNIQHIVSFLIDEGKLGGFHFNDKKYADDDLTVGSIDPYQLFLIFCELVAGEGRAIDVAYMIDQSHNLKPKIEAMIQSVLNIQTAYAKALLVDRKKLAEAQLAGDIVTAENTLKSAFETDVRPLVAKVRQELDRPSDPLAAYRASGYAERAARERS
jgi:L-rhamnose isomerase/sugar isomerase